MLNCVAIKRWAIVVPVTLLKITEHYMSKVLESTSTNLGISMLEPFYIQIENEEITSFTRELKILFNKEKPQLVFCILSSNREDRYRAIKKICSVEYGGEFHLQAGNVIRGFQNFVSKYCYQKKCVSALSVNIIYIRFYSIYVFLLHEMVKQSVYIAKISITIHTRIFFAF